MTRPQYVLILRTDGSRTLIEQRTGHIVPPGRIRAMHDYRGGVLVEFHREQAVFLMEDEIRREEMRKTG
jgi:hypothetical protein